MSNIERGEKRVVLHGFTRTRVKLTAVYTLPHMAVTLDQIVATTRTRVAADKQRADVRALERAAGEHRPRGFRAALERKASAGVAVIAELKKASPSKGVLRATMHVAAIAREYEKGGAAALSVLTDEPFFQGSLANLREASAATELPCLRKDFIIDEFQILEARANNADAILLIVAALSDAELRTLHGRARECELDVLCEVHDAEELRRAIDHGFDIIGVNNRNLRTFEVTLQTAVELARQFPAGALRVAESGIHTANDMRLLRTAGYNTFLIGESLITKASPGEALRSLLDGVCETERTTAQIEELRANR